MLPEEFLKRMEEMLGEEYPAFLESYQGGKCHALRVNTEKCGTEWLREQEGFHLTPVPWCEEGFYYQEDDRPGRHPFHSAGAYYIQDASAMAPVEYLDPKPGERVLDLCGAPGGKSTQIGAAMKGQGLFVCNEIHAGRAKILSENVERMGIRNALVTNETPQRLAGAFPEYFHKILVDAPCSGEGMFRKNDEAIGEWSLENVEMCGRRQDEILDCALSMLRPGGRLVYSTCTFAPTEDEGAIARLLTRHPQLSLEETVPYPGMEPGRPQWGLTGEAGAGPGCLGESKDLHLERALRLWPHKIQGEGHFLAVVRKPEGEVLSREPRELLGLREKDCREYLDFLGENLEDGAIPQGSLVRFGEQLYLAPVGCPSLDKLRVLRCGLHLGTMKKNRFQPSHALALTLKPNQVKHCVSFQAGEPQVEAYLKGQTLECASLEKGWYLVAVEGMSLGWGKYAGNVMKNHYPKGLRW